MTERVLVVDDDAQVCDALAQTLELAGLDVLKARSFIVAKDRITSDFGGIILTDIRMPGRDGMFLLDYVKGLDPDLPVILLTGEGDIPMAVEAIHKGAFDFLEKPCPTETMVASVRRALQARGLVLENRKLREEVTNGDAASRLLFGSSVQAESLRQQVRQIASLRSSVLIRAAPGSGVSKLAEVLHLLSDRVSEPFVKSGSAGLGRGELDSAIERAGEGSLFLDEIGLLPEDTQFALIEALDQPARARILAGTTRALRDLAESGDFSSDLYYRLEAFQVRIPALRERPEDIPILFKHYVAQACEQAGVPVPEIPQALLADLMSRDWPGNARSLMNAAMRFALGLNASSDGDALGLAERMAQIERTILTDALRQSGGNASATAEMLKLPRKTLYDKFSKYGIRPEDFR